MPTPPHLPAPPASSRLAVPREVRRGATRILVAAVTPGVASMPGLPEDAHDPRLAILPTLAEGHGVAAIVEPVLAGRLPPAAARALEDAAARTLARGARLADDRERIEAALVAAGVPFAWLKGARIAALYDPPEARPLADLDVWIPADHQPAAAAVLRRLGYLESASTWRHRTFLRPDNVAVVDARGEHPDNPRPIELHARVGEAFRGLTLDLTEAVGLGVTEAVGGRLSASSRRGMSEAISPGVALTHVAAHATVDALSRRARLIQWVDLARLAASAAPADWAECVELAGTPHGARFVWPALALAERTLGAAPPAAVRDELARHVAAPLAAWVDGVDLDALSFFGRDSAPRALLEIPMIWPRTPAERLAVWRFILAPPRRHLADRDPAATAGRWPAAYVHHAAYTVRRLRSRWRQRTR